jgi:heat shock protein HtpX
MYKEIDSNKRRTVFLMGLFLLFVIAVGYVLSWYFGNYFILVIAVIIAVTQSLISYYYSDSISLAVSGAKEVPRKDPFMQIHRIVENLSITAGLPKPKIYIINDTATNAFATGRDPKHASIAVTSGLLDKLDKNELEGVIAHELSHVGNYDIRLMTIIVVLVGVVALISDFAIRWMWFGNRRSSNESGQGQAVMLIVAIVLAILAPIAAKLIQLSISRKREYLADASGALLTRYPEGLASALEKISQDTEPLEVANRATAHLYIESPFRKNVKDQDSRSWFSGLFDTHPPVQDRIKRLRAMISK